MRVARPRCGPCDSQREARLRLRRRQRRWRLATATRRGRISGQPPKLSIGRTSKRAPRATKESCHQRRHRRCRLRLRRRCCCIVVHRRARLGHGATAVARRARRSTQRPRSFFLRGGYPTAVSALYEKSAVLATLRRRRRAIRSPPEETCIHEGVKKPRVLQHALWLQQGNTSCNKVTRPATR